MAGKEYPRRQSILDTALEMITAAGYDGTSVADIADRLGLSKSAITYYFPAKEDLIYAIAAPYLDAVDAVLDSHPNPAWPAGVRSLFGDYFRVLVANRRLAIWVDTDIALLRHEPVARRRTEIRHRLTSAIAGGSTDVEDEARALAAIGGLWRPLRILDESILEAIEDEIVEAALVSYQPLTP